MNGYRPEYTVSLDGKIADKDGNVDWLYSIANKEQTDYGYNLFYGSIDTTIQGHNTYIQTKLMNKEFPYKGKKNYVFTSKQEIKEDAEVTFVHENPVEYTQQIKSQDGKNIWLIGGGKLIALLFDAGLIDEMQICIMPIVIGDGVPLFNLPIREQTVRLTEMQDYENGAVLLKYQKVL